MTNYTQKAVRGAGVTLFFSILASLVAYLTRVYLARNLLPEEYGLFYAVLTFVLFFLFFRDLGLGQALVKYVAEFRVKQEMDKIKTAIVSVFAFQLLGSLLFGTVFFLLADYLGEHYFKSPLASFILKMLIVYVLFSIIFIIVKHTFQGFLRITWFSSVELVKNALVLLLLFLFFNLGYAQLSPVYAFALISPLIFVLYLPLLLKTFPFFHYKVKEFWSITRKLLEFGLPVFATDVGGKVIGYIDTLILTYFVSLSEVGVYNVVLPSALVFVFFSKAFSSILLPLSSELWTRKDLVRLRVGVGLLHKYAFAGILPVMLAIAYFAKFLITAFFGEAYSSGYLALQILIVGVLFYVVASINTNLISGIGKPKTVAVIIIIAAAINAAVNLALIPFYGINGAAIATTLSYLFILLASTYKAAEYLEARFPWKEWVKLLFPAFSFLGVMFLTEKALQQNPWVELFVSTAVAGMVYLLLAYILRIVNVKELKFYLKLMRLKDEKSS